MRVETSLSASPRIANAAPKMNDAKGQTDIPGKLRRQSAPPRRFDFGDVNFLHAHHRLERPLCFIPSGRQRVRQDARRNLPGYAPFVLAPPARALLSAIPDDSVPVAVRLLLIVRGDLE